MRGNVQGSAKMPGMGKVHRSMDAKRPYLNKSKEGAQPGAGLVVCKAQKRVSKHQGPSSLPRHPRDSRKQNIIFLF